MARPLPSWTRMADSSGLLLSGWLEAVEGPKAQLLLQPSPPPSAQLPSSLEEGSLFSVERPAESRLAEEGKVTRRLTQ